MGNTSRRDEQAVRSYWSDADLATLVRMANAEATTRQIALELHRTPKAVRNKASALGLQLSGYDVRLAARRHDGAGLHGRSLRTRRSIRVGVDFDISTLTRAERKALVARLLEATPPSRAVVAPPAYDPSAAATARLAAVRAHRAALGWDRRREKKSTGPSRREQRRRQRVKKMQEWYARTLAKPASAAPLPQNLRNARDLPVELAQRLRLEGIGPLGGALRDAGGMREWLASLETDSSEMESVFDPLELSEE